MNKSKQWKEGFNKGRDAGLHEGREMGREEGEAQGEFQANVTMAEKFNILVHSMELALGEGHYRKWVILNMMKDIIAEHVTNTPKSWGKDKSSF